MNVLKKRKAKNSKRGIFLMDKELTNTNFDIGSHYKYIIDNKNKKVIIVGSTDENDNTVSKKKTNIGITPVIDIRKKAALNVFDSYDYLQVVIYEDKIVVEGYVNSNENDETKSFVNKITSKIKNTFTKAKVKDITQVLKVKKQVELVLSKKDLQNSIINGYSQITIDDYLSQIETVSINLKESSAKKRLKNIKSIIEAVSLFSGAGLMDIGFIEEGFDVVFASDLDEYACKTYKRNFGNHVVCEDITKLDKKLIPKVPLMFAGPPCQGFSNENRTTNFLENPKNQLIKHYIQAIKANEECKVFVLENVPQILTIGDGRFKNEILESLSDFEITYGVLSAADYGCPQDRKRAVFIGSKIGKIELPKPTHSKGGYVTVREAFSQIDINTPNQADCAKSKADTIEKMKFIPQGGNVFNIPENIRPKGTHSCFYKRLHLDMPSITIVNPSRSMILHPEEDRLISVRESAALQGVPNTHIFEGTLFSKYQQIANGVPVQLAKALAKEIKKAFMNYRLKLNTNLQLV